MLDCSDIESAEMVEFHARRISQQRFEVGRIIAGARGESDEVFVGAAIGKLDETQPVARRDKPHRLGIDGDRGAGREQIGGYVAFVKMNCHIEGRSRPRLNAQWPSLTQRCRIGR